MPRNWNHMKPFKEVFFPLRKAVWGSSFPEKLWTSSMSRTGLSFIIWWHSWEPLGGGVWWERAGPGVCLWRIPFLPRPPSLYALLVWGQQLCSNGTSLWRYCAPAHAHSHGADNGGSKSMTPRVKLIFLPFKLYVRNIVTLAMINQASSEISIPKEWNQWLQKLHADG